MSKVAKPVKKGVVQVQSQKPKTAAGKARTDKSRRTGQPVTITNPLFSNQSNPANSTPGKIDVSHCVQLDIAHLNHVVSCFTQEVKYYLNPEPQIGDNRFWTFYVTIFEDLKRAMIGAISVFVEAPLIYRELFEAMTPTSSRKSGQITQRYYFDPDQVKGAQPLAPSGTHWGAPVSYDAVNMLVLEDPPIASEDFSVTAEMFKAFKTRGAAWWVASNKSTIFMDDTSVFAYPTDLTNQPLKNTNWQASHEVPITHIWLAGLRLAGPGEKENRQLNHHVTMYAGPQSHLGYRMSSQLNGNEERYTQCRVKMVDVTELFYLSKSQVLGCQRQYGASTTTRDTDQGVPDSDVVPYYDGDSTAFRVFMAGIICVAQFKEASSNSGYISNLLGIVPLPFANQYYPKSTNQQNIEQFFSLIVENLRRLKIISTEENNGKKFVTSNVFVSSLNIAEPELQVPWTGDLFAANALDPRTFVTSGGPGVINNLGDVNVPGTYPSYVTNLMVHGFKAQPFCSFSSPNDQRDMAGQQLTNLTRYVDTPDLVDPEPNPPALRSKKMDHRYNAKAVSIVKGFSEDKRIVKVATTINTNNLLVGVFFSVGNKAPSKQKQDLLYALVLPLWPADPPLVKNTDRVVACSTRMGDFGQSPTATSNQSYYLTYQLTGAQNTYPRGAIDYPTELTRLMRQNTNVGLGGNMTDKIRMAIRIAASVANAGIGIYDEYGGSAQRVK